MGARHADRIWLGAGAAFVLVLTAVTWFLVIGPRYAEADEVRGQTASAEIQIAVLRNRISGLDQQKAKLPQYRAALKRAQNALPPDSGLPDFLRQLQSAGDDVGVDVGGISVSAPVRAEGSTTVWSLPITLTANGQPDKLGDFLNQLQNTQPRAVLVQSASLTAQPTEATADAANPGTVSLNLSVQVFVSTPAGGGVPSITTTK